jgi:hypothetical protein
MASIVVTGDTSGSITLSAPAVAGSNTLTLPANTGTIITTASGSQSIPKAALPTGSVLQVVNTQSSTYTSTVTAIPSDNTIPQNSEGAELFTASITPTSSASKLFIQVVVELANSGAAWLAIALFQDSTANALAANTIYQGTATGGSILTINYFMTAGTTSSTTFKVRYGANSGTTYANGSSAQVFNGTLFSSLNITEIAA